MVHQEIEPEAFRPNDGSPWHLAEVERPLTLCGRIVEYGWRRRMWAETPEDERCRLCLQRSRDFTNP